MRLLRLSILCLAALTVSLHAPAAAKKQGAHTFAIKGGEFVYDGKPVRLLSGEMHYPRIPHQYWRHRMQMLRAMGLNTVATYVFWNAHEPQPGVWDFTGDNDLAQFIRIAGEEGLHVILRPGPYVCAEWEFGGYPWWLQNVEGLVLRADNEPFLTHTKKYIDRLYAEVGELLITRGGPVIMVQVENEFGSYVFQRKDIPLESHRAYNARIKQQLIDAGFDTPMFTYDGSWLFEGGSTPGALPTANGENNVAKIKEVVNQWHNGEGPYMVAEFYPGWLMHWAEPFPDVDASQIARKTDEYLREGVSFNFFMAHGGTNFAFTAGANYNKEHDIQPDLTSYDYDAPITEAGWATPKFDSIRGVIGKYTGGKLPRIPDPIAVIEIPEIKLTRVADVLAYLRRQDALTADQPMTFEQMNQAYGYVLYSRHFNQPAGGELEVAGLCDYATIYVDDAPAGELNRYYKRYTAQVDIPFNSTLELLVENMGRINYGSQIIENNKGIVSPVKVNGEEVEGGWSMRGLPMDAQPDLDAQPASAVMRNEPAATARLAGRPLLYEGTFTLSQTGDTFLDMSAWGKGIVFVNGRNLGRYWSVGPQQTLYLPGVWLKKGENRIVVFEQLSPQVHTHLTSTKIPILKNLE
ncbi:MAG: beta-galactosidase [Rikenellaceae bacterium]|jgi:beta-galactosidase|nr:beta-galactosidase [Rikenellaceae bacterium]